MALALIVAKQKVTAPELVTPRKPKEQDVEMRSPSPSSSDLPSSFVSPELKGPPDTKSTAPSAIRGEMRRRGGKQTRIPKAGDQGRTTKAKEKDSNKRASPLRGSAKYNKYDEFDTSDGRRKY